MVRVPGLYPVGLGFESLGAYQVAQATIIYNEVEKMINTVRLRNSLGILGMLLPVIVLVLSLLNGYGFPDSISATYYLDPCITPFMIILGAAGLLLISYRGYDR